MKEVKLNLIGIFTTHPNLRIAHYILLLQEAVEKKRTLPMLIEPVEARSLSNLNPRNSNNPSLIFIHDLFGSVLNKFGYHVQKAMITEADVKKDSYAASIVISDGKDHTFSLDLRAVDAIAMSLCFQAPIFTYDAILQKSEHLMTMINAKIILEQQKLDPGTSKYVTQRQMDNIMLHNLENHSVLILQDLLNRVLEREDYEQAARIRDEIRRKKQEDNQLGMPCL